MEAFLTSCGIVALAEIGDKTQLLAILLSARFRRPGPIIMGIFVATIANHALAALVGLEASHLLAGPWFMRFVGLSFVAIGLWTLKPDHLDASDGPAARRGAFLSTLGCFFVAEMGDKTQLATVALAARFHSASIVAAGTTVGMMIANVPAVLLGGVLLSRVPLRLVHLLAAAAFIVIGCVVLAGSLGWS
jgi:putative Ca2+/H+ antiporter (TMEM165/GDT1 family)